MTDNQIDIENDGLNELIKSFLVELKNDAHRKASKMEFVYANALKSLRAHTDKLMRIDDFKKLKYFGDKSCSILQKKLDDYCKKNSIQLPVDSRMESNTDNNSSNDVLVDTNDQNQQNSQSQSEKQKQKRTQSKRQYVPKFQSSAFAIMIALYKLEQNERNYSVSKIDLIKQAEMVLGEKNNENQLSSMWTAMKTLAEKQLISVEKSRCNYYSLTDLGRELSAKMYGVMVEKLNLNPNQLIRSTSNDDEEDSLEQEDNEELDDALNANLVYFPGTYEIVLIIDSREQYSGAATEQRKTKLVSDLENMGINCEMRTLPVGDFAWVIKPVDSASSSATVKRELVLDFLIERKKLDDLISSIRDQRWGEQKHRLKRCGIPNIVYLIEGFSSIKSDHPCYKSINTALANAQLIDGFTVKHTKDFKDTLSYLALMSKYLEKYYKEKTLFSTSKKDKADYPLRENHFLTVNEFSCESQKMSNFTTKEMFVRSLMRFHSATLEKCKAITNVYPTLPELLQAYDECETLKSKEQLLSSITYGIPEKKINNNLSKMICTYFTYRTANDIEPIN